MELKDFQNEIEKLEGKLKSETSETIKSEIKAQIDSTNALIDDLKSSVNELKAKNGKIINRLEGNKSFGEQIKEALDANKNTLVEASKGNDNPKLRLKAAANMTLGNYSGGTVGLSTFDNQFALVARRNPYLRQIVRSFPVSSKYVAWAEQANRDGGAGQTAEGAAKTMADFDIVEANKVVEKITAYSKVSKEMLADIPFMANEINNDLISLVNLKLDTDLFSGTGTTPALKGINVYATTFSAPSGLGTAIDNATELDVLRAAIAQVELAFFSPNYILLHPTDVAKIDMLKSTTNEYLVHQSAGQFMFKSFYGLPIIASTVVTQGQFLVGDFTKSNLGISEEINIQIGLDSDDFTKNLVTILAEVRAVHYIKSNHTTAFVKGTFSTAKTALETP